MLLKYSIRLVRRAKFAERIENWTVVRCQSSGRGKDTSITNPTGGSESTSQMINGVPLPPEPTHCCNSGCPNCVWIKYAQEVTQLFDDGDVIAKNKILEKVEDPKLRAFLLTQLGLNEKES